VDAAGSPAAWAPLRTLTDSTKGLQASGTVTFDPPADWKPASVGGSARLYYVRYRTTADGRPPVAAAIQGRDYVNARGGHEGTIPAFDAAADKDGDGNLSDAEYAGRRAGFDARFEYEGRMFYPYYGQHRYATNVADPGFRAWAADYHFRYLESHPLAGGVFVDNSLGRIAVEQGTVQESLAGYADNYGSLLAAVNARIAPKWVLANTAGGGITAEPQVKNGVSYLEEFAIRAMAANHIQFEDMAGMIARRRELSGGNGYEVFDSLPTGGSPTDGRTQLATLAYYYQVADPDTSFLMFNGGHEPATTWTRHWSDAVTVDVGRPQGDSALFATGVDPSNKKLTYKVFGREYGNALVLYKPLSYTRGLTGTTADNTATTHDLGGTYRPVRADGSLGEATTHVTLRNGEGAILVKV
jgi:hypothetical protein